MNAKPGPVQLWQQAQDEGGSIDVRWARYLDLMREHGYVVDAKPGESRDLPCGYPSRSSFADLASLIDEEMSPELIAGLREMADQRRRVEAESRNIVMP